MLQKAIKTGAFYLLLSVILIANALAGDVPDVTDYREASNETINAKLQQYFADFEEFIISKEGDSMGFGWGASIQTPELSNDRKDVPDEVANYQGSVSGDAQSAENRDLYYKADYYLEGALYQMLRFMERDGFNLAKITIPFLPFRGDTHSYSLIERESYACNVGNTLALLLLTKPSLERSVNVYRAERYKRELMTVHFDRMFIDVRRCRVGLSQNIGKYYSQNAFQRCVLTYRLLTEDFDRDDLIHLIYQRLGVMNVFDESDPYLSESSEMLEPMSQVNAHFLLGL